MKVGDPAYLPDSGKPVVILEIIDNPPDPVFAKCQYDENGVVGYWPIDTLIPANSE